MANKVIFLPFFYTTRSLCLLTLQTYGQPMRYFDSPYNHLLETFWRSVIGLPKDVKTLGEMVIGEREAWDIKYCFVKAVRENDCRYNAAYHLTEISSIEDIFNSVMPEELRAAIVRIVTHELSSTVTQ